MLTFSIRYGWLSVGNQIGPAFENLEADVYNCSECQTQIKFGVKRYKSKLIAKYNLCPSCFSNRNELLNNYFVFENSLSKAVFHDGNICTICKQYPIRGIRFSHAIEFIDLCECMCIIHFNDNVDCFDETLSTTDVKEYIVEEFPRYRGNVAVHYRIKCAACDTIPIIGEVFECSECDNIALCRNCFFLEKVCCISAYMFFRNRIITKQHTK